MMGENNIIGYENNIIGSQMIIHWNVQKYMCL